MSQQLKPCILGPDFHNFRIAVGGVRRRLFWQQLGLRRFDPGRLKLRRLWRRTSNRIRNDVELWNGNRESWWDAVWGPNSLFVWMLRTHVGHRREWPRRFSGDPRFVRLRSAAEARAWLELREPG